MRYTSTSPGQPGRASTLNTSLPRRHLLVYNLERVASEEDRAPDGSMLHVTAGPSEDMLAGGGLAFQGAGLQAFSGDAAPQSALAGLLADDLLLGAEELSRPPSHEAVPSSEPVPGGPGTVRPSIWARLISLLMHRHTAARPSPSAAVDLSTIHAHEVARPAGPSPPPPSLQRGPQPGVLLHNLTMQEHGHILRDFLNLSEDELHLLTPSDHPDIYYLHPSAGLHIVAGVMDPTSVPSHMLVRCMRFAPDKLSCQLLSIQESLCQRQCCTERPLPIDFLYHMPGPAS